MWITNLARVWSVENLICLAILLGISVYDIRFRQIHKVVLVVGGILAAGSVVFGKTVSIPSAAAGLAAGGFFLGMAYVTGEKIGYGDGLLIGVLGLYLGIWKLVEVLSIAWLGLLLAAGFYLVWKGWSRRADLPLSPFLTAGFAAVICLSAG